MIKMKNILTVLGFIVLTQVAFGQTSSLQVIDFSIREDYSISLDSTKKKNSEEKKLYVSFKISDIANADGVSIRFLDAQNAEVMEMKGQYNVEDQKTVLKIQKNKFVSAQYETNFELVLPTSTYNQVKKVVFYVEDKSGKQSNVSNQTIR